MGGCCTSNHNHLESEFPYYKICIVNPTKDYQSTLASSVTSFTHTPNSNNDSVVKSPLEMNIPFYNRDIKTVINNKTVVLNLWEKKSDLINDDGNDEEQKNYSRFFYIGCDIMVIIMSYTLEEDKLEDMYRMIIKELQ